MERDVCESCGRRVGSEGYEIPVRVDEDGEGYVPGYIPLCKDCMSVLMDLIRDEMWRRNII